MLATKRAMATLADNEMMLQIIIDADTVAGDQVSVATPDGSTYMVQIPDGVKTGEKLNIICKKPVEPVQMEAESLTVDLFVNGEYKEDSTVFNSTEGGAAAGGEQQQQEEQEEGEAKKREPTDPNSLGATAGAIGAGAIAGVVVVGAVTGPIIAGVACGGAALYASTRNTKLGRYTKYVNM